MKFLQWYPLKILKFFFAYWNFSFATISCLFFFLKHIHICIHEGKKLAKTAMSRHFTGLDKISKKSRLNLIMSRLNP